MLQLLAKKLEKRNESFFRKHGKWKIWKISCHFGTVLTKLWTKREFYKSRGLQKLKTIMMFYQKKV